MKDNVQIWKPLKGVWLLIDKNSGEYISHSKEKFLDIPVAQKIKPTIKIKPETI